MRANYVRRARSFPICLALVVAAVMAMSSPAHAASGSTNRPGLLAGTPVTLAVPLPIVGKTLTVGDAGVSVVSRVAHVSVVKTARTGPAIRRVHRVIAETTATRSLLATTSPGLVSVVPIGPLPTGLRPHVAAESAQSRSVAPAVGGARGLPALPVGFWFALVLLALLLGTVTFFVADRDGYRVAVSITKRYRTSLSTTRS